MVRPVQYLTPEQMVDRWFGRLYVQAVAGLRGADVYRPYLECVCRCGNLKVARYDNVRDGRTASCGCIRKECARQKGPKMIAAQGPVRGPGRSG